MHLRCGWLIQEQGENIDACTTTLTKVWKSGEAHANGLGQSCWGADRLNAPEVQFGNHLIGCAMPGGDKHPAATSIRRFGSNLNRRSSYDLAFC